MTAISRRLLFGLAATRLAAVSTPAAKVDFYRGRVDGTPRVMTVADGKSDPEGRVAAYVVIAGGAGDPLLEPSLAGTDTELLWPFTTICAAGHHDTVLDLVDRVHDRLHGWVPQLDGHSFGRCAPPSGFDPGTVRLDRNVTPPRPHLALLWQIPVTTT